MRVFITAVALLWLCNVAGCASQEPTSAVAQDADPEVCKRIKVTGSRLGTRICMKQSEWDQLSEESSDEVRLLRRTGNIQTGSVK